MAIEKVKLFVGWSGDRSKALATALCDWLPMANHFTDPWMSEKDVAAGARWERAIAERLREADLGIMCLTPENMDSRWILFEAGALSNKFSSTNEPEVCAYLLDLTGGAVEPPLGQFQYIEAKDRGRNHHLLKTINGLLGEDGLSEKALDESFNMWWPELEAKIDEIGPPVAPAEKKRSPEDMLSELLGLARAANKFIERQPNRPGSAFSSAFSPSFGSGVEARRTHAQRASEILSEDYYNRSVAAAAKKIIVEQFGEETWEKIEAKRLKEWVGAKGND